MGKAIVDVGSVRRADQDDLGGPSDPAPGSVVAVEDAGAKVVAHGGAHGEIDTDEDAVVGQLVGRSDSRSEQQRR